MLHGAFAMLDDHNNSLVQANQGIRLSWPTAVSANFTSLDLGIPTTYLNTLPSSESILNGLLATPYATYGANPDNKIPYAMQFNLGVQQQLPSAMAMKLDYVGSLSRHQYINSTVNTALYPGPGPISARQPFPQYGGPFSFEWNEGTGNYNALQAELTQRVSNGLFFRLAYTWSKSMDIQSDPYGNEAPNFYNLQDGIRTSVYSLNQHDVFSSVYQLPLGKRKDVPVIPNGLLQTAAWAIGTWAASSPTLQDNPSTRWWVRTWQIRGVQINGRIRWPDVNAYAGLSLMASGKQWLNPAALVPPATYTYGNESRDDLVGPGYTDVDISAYKNFPIPGESDRCSSERNSSTCSITPTTRCQTPPSNLEHSDSSPLRLARVARSSSPSR